MLSKAQVERFHQEGFLRPLPALDAEEVAASRDGVATLERLRGQTIKRMSFAHLFFPWAWRLATHPQIVSAAADLLGDEVLVYGTLLLNKPAHDPSFVSWHQDSVYSKPGNAPLITAWVALTPSRPENGCMRVIPGSHRAGRVAHREAPTDANLLRRGEEVADAVLDEQAAALELAPGQMSLHDCHIIHGSRPNRSDTDRTGFIIRFVNPDYPAQGPPLTRAGLGAPGAPPPFAEPAEAYAAWSDYAKGMGNPL